MTAAEVKSSDLNYNWKSHPLDTVIECCIKRNIGFSELALRLNMNHFQLRDFLAERMQIDNEIAEKLTFFGVDKEFWLDRQAGYNKYATQQEGRTAPDLEELFLKEAELRYPVKDHSTPNRSPYAVSQITFLHGCRFGAEYQSSQPRQEWVKAMELMPTGQEKKKLHIKYKGVPDVLVFLNGRWCWNDNSFSAAKDFVVQKDSWSAIEWLSEPTAPTEDIKH